ncbi:MAG: winged helix-turn-helix domain-containing protein [Phycisphaerales bacterium]|nr:winged helix-turn-helix domain-containing protein [Phycisphaerales bacterium]
MAKNHALRASRAPADTSAEAPSVADHQTPPRAVLLPKAETTKPTRQAAAKPARAAKPRKGGAKGKATKAATTAARRKPGAKQPKRTSMLDAAATVLADAKEPMRSRQLIEKMSARKLWSSAHGKTPHQTLFAGIIREIAEMGKDARFRKVGRGLFSAAKAR